MRILPHHQDTGAFFVAVFEKVKPLPWENCQDDGKMEVESKIEVEKEKPAVNEKIGEELSLEEEAAREMATGDKNFEGKRPLDGEKKAWGPQRKRKRVVGYREDPFVFFKDDKEDVWPSIK